MHLLVRRGVWAFLGLLLSAQVTASEPTKGDASSDANHRPRHSDPRVERLLSRAAELGNSQEGVATLWRELNEENDDDFSDDGILGAKCGNDRPPCLSPNECTDLGLVLGHRCAPVTCIREELELLKQEHNLEAWQQIILAEAGVAETDVVDEFEVVAEGSTTFSIIPNLRKASPFAADQESLMQALQNHPEYTDMMQNIIRKCTSIAPKTTEMLCYYGIHIEVGVGLDFSYSSMGGNTDLVCCPFGRVCFGAVGVGAMVGVNFGAFLCGPDKKTDQISDFYFLGELDLGVGPAFGFQIGVGVQGYSFIEFGVGAGGYGGIGGSLCCIFDGGLIDPPI